MYAAMSCLAAFISTLFLEFIFTMRKDGMATAISSPMTPITIRSSITLMPVCGCRQRFWAFRNCMELVRRERGGSEEEVDVDGGAEYLIAIATHSQQGYSPMSHTGSLTIYSILAICTVANFSQPIAAQEVTFHIDLPLLDRWNYPWNQTPGTRSTAPVFSSYIETDFYEDPFFGGFDERDGQFHVGFATGGHVESGLGVSSYNITAARVTLMNATNNAFIYSLTLPQWQWYLPPDDPEFQCPVAADPCPPGNTVIPEPALKLFGVGFRNGFNALSYQETTAYSPQGPWGAGHRTAYALDFDEAGNPRDVSNNVADGFNPTPFALGTTNLALGQLVPAARTFTFEIEVNDPHIQQYLREGLDLGVLHFMVATLHITEQEEGGGSPEFYCKEHALVTAGFRDAAGLEMTVEIVDEPRPKLGDLNNDGFVNGFDLLILLGQWGMCPPRGECDADLNDDGSVDGFDLLILLSNWG